MGAIKKSVFPPHCIKEQLLSLAVWLELRCKKRQEEALSLKEGTGLGLLCPAGVDLENLTVNAFDAWASPWLTGTFSSCLQVGFVGKIGDTFSYCGPATFADGTGFVTTDSDWHSDV